MTATLTLTDFLLARIADDEAWAQAAVATPGANHWHWVESETDKPVAPDPFTQEAITDDGAVSLRSVEELAPVSWGSGQPLPDFVIWSVDDMLSPGAAGHIARHDPARVLADCEAKRRILEWHKSWPVLVQSQPKFEVVDSADANSFAMRASQQVAWTTEQAYRDQFGTEPPTGPVLRLLALPYADHPDYREEWRP